MLETLKNINIAWLNYLNSLWEYKSVDIFVRFFADTPIFLLPIFLVCYWLYYTFKNKNLEKKEELLLIFFSVILGISISLIIQQIISIDRPENYINGTWKLLLKHIPDASFPSDHATVASTFLFSILFYWYKKIFWILIILFSFMLVSRVIAWVHWPFDILAWIVVWLLSAVIIFKLRNKKFVKSINLAIIKIMNFIKL